MCESLGFGVLIGKTIKSITGIDNDNIYIQTETGDCFNIYHAQGCCEYVRVWDTVGNLQDIIGSKILSASEYCDDKPDDVDYESYDSYTWTIYEIVTDKGKFTIRWLGESNGYYGETPYFMRSHAIM